MATKVVKRAYKYRYYPTPAQALELARTFGCTRLVWNTILDRRTRRYITEKASTSYADSNTMLTQLKKEDDYTFLNEVSSVPLQQVLRHQHKALQGFFEKRGGYPNFKSKKKDKNSAEYTRSGFRIKDGNIYLAKMREPLDIRWSRKCDLETASTITVSQDKAGRYFVSILCESVVEELPKIDKTVGIDWGVTTAITTSDGNKMTPNLAKAQKAVIKAQKNYSHKEKGSARQEKARLQLARKQAKVADIRKDWLHKVTTQLVRENQTIVVEDLNVAGMSKSVKGKGRAAKAGLNRGILSHAPAEFRELLSYKCDWYGRELVVADRWFPSSQLCSHCGYRVGKLPLRVRSWVCPECSARHDRDQNAAVNLFNVALGLRETRNARGGPVRPLDASVSVAGTVEARIPRL